MFARISFVLVGLSVVLLGSYCENLLAQKAPSTEAAKSKSSTVKAVDRTRWQVQMLDGIYKDSIVLVTKHYVEGDEDVPAGTAFKKLFEIAKKNGWHEVRLVDATGEPYGDENVAKSDFEKQAVKQLKTGKPFVEKVIKADGKRYLLAATPIPVVWKSARCATTTTTWTRRASLLVPLPTRYLSTNREKHGRQVSPAQWRLSTPSVA